MQVISAEGLKLFDYFPMSDIVGLHYDSSIYNFLKLQMFSWWLYQFILPSTVQKRLPFCTFTTVLSLVFLIMGILPSMRQNLELVLICVYLIAKTSNNFLNVYQLSIGVHNFTISAWEPDADAYLSSRPSLFYLVCSRTV